MNTVAIPVARVRIVYAKDLHQRLSTIERNIAVQVAMQIEADIRSSAPVDTGELRGSIRRRATRVVISAEHWAHVEYGTRPHPIYPRVKRALWWKGAPHPMPMVNHPGTPAQPYIRPAASKPRKLRPVSPFPAGRSAPGVR